MITTGFAEFTSPDLELDVGVEPSGGRIHLAYRLRFGNRRFGSGVRNLGSVSIAADPAAYLKELFGEIRQLRSKGEPPLTERRLVGIGVTLLELLPMELRRELWSIYERVRGSGDPAPTLYLTSNESWVPWELLRLRDPDGKTKIGVHLAGAFALTRWLHGHEDTVELPLCDVAVVVPKGSVLPEADGERQMILERDGRNGRRVTPVEPASYEAVTERLESFRHDGWHFAGHGLPQGDDPNLWAFRLEDRESLKPLDLAEIDLRESRPLVFMNSCHGGRGGLTLTGAGGWAAAFLEAGAGAFIGAYWEVSDGAAKAFAEAFYEGFLRGLPLGGAAHAARARVREEFPGDPTWAAYTVYAHPSAVCRGVGTSRRRLAAGPAPRYWNVPRRNPYFTGREEVLAALHHALTVQDPAAVGQAISGLGGIGKTQTAVEYCHRHREDYSAVFWVRAQTPAEVRLGLAEVAGALGLPEAGAPEEDAAVAAMLRWLETNAGWLLVFDNADHPEWLRPFLPQNVRGYILVTSRAPTFGAVGIKRPFRLATLPSTHAQALLLERSEREEVSEDERRAVAELAEELGCLPLALEQAAAYVGTRRMPFRSYLDRYRRRRLDLLEKTGPETGDYPASVATTWTLSLQVIESESRASADLLRALAFLAPDAIPLAVFETGAVELATPLADTLEEEGVEEVLEPLLRYSLVERDVDARTVNVHRMVQVVAQAALDEKAERIWAQRVVLALGRAFPNPGTFATWSLCERIYPHVLVAAELVDRLSLERPEAALLLHRAGTYAKDRARFEEAEALYKRSLALRERALGGEHPDVGGSLNNLANLYRGQGRYEEAEPLYRRCLAIQEKALGNEHPAVGTTLNNLALLCGAQQRYDEAESLLRWSLTLQERALGPGHPDIGTSLDNLANLLRYQGSHEEAESLFRRSLAIREEALGPDHPHVGTTLNNLALLYYAQERYEEADRLFRRSLAIQEKALGGDHPRVAHPILGLAVLLQKTGAFAEAETLFMRGLAILETARGLAHPLTVEARQLYQTFLDARAGIS